MTVPKGYSPFRAATRDSSMQRAIIALSVAPHEIAIALFLRFSRTSHSWTGSSRWYRRSHELHFDLVAAAKPGFISAAVSNSRSPSQCPISLQGEVAGEETDSAGSWRRH